MITNDTPEIWDLYDVYGNFVRKIRRGEPLPPGLYHKTVEVIPADRKGHLLITRRSPNKRDGGLFEFPAGSVISGEDPKQTAIRELFEETGIRVPENRVRYIGQYAPPLNRKDPKPGIRRMYFLAYVENLTEIEIHLEPSESVSYRFVTFEEWKSLLDPEIYVKNRIDGYEAMDDKFFPLIKSFVGKPPKPKPEPVQEASTKPEQVKPAPKPSLNLKPVKGNPFAAIKRKENST